MSLFTMTAHELKDKLLSREISAMELLDSVYGQIEGVEPQVQAYITLTKELAQEQAKAVDEGFQRGSAQAGAGIPIAIKDNISVAGVPNTCASKMLANYRPPFHATVVEKLIAAGMPILGKTNMDEFATGSSSESSWYHPTRNPWDLARVPGGVQWGLCRRGQCRGGNLGPGDRYRGFPAATGSLLRRGRVEAYLWIDLPLWGGCRGLFPRSCGSGNQGCYRLRLAAAKDRGIRWPGLHLSPGGDSRLRQLPANKTFGDCELGSRRNSLSLDGL